MIASDIYQLFTQMIFSLSAVSLETCLNQKPLLLTPIPFYRMGFTKNHKAILTLNGKEQLLETGEVIFIRPETTVQIRAEKDKETEVFFVVFSYWTEQAGRGSTERQFIQNGADFPLKGTISVRSHSQLLHLMEELHKSFLSSDYREKFRQRLLFERILYIVVRDLSLNESSETTLSNIEETIEYVEQHYMLNLTLETLAGKANVSPSYYSRMFKTLKGVSFSDYLTGLRIARAKVLLQLPASRLREVAQSVGYNDEFYFSKMFKKVVSVSPSEYVKTHMRQDNS